MRPLSNFMPGQLWPLKAACRDLPPAVAAFFFSGTLVEIERAKQICVDCPVRVECLEWALANDEEVGVWGGLSKDERMGRTTRRIRSRHGSNL